MTGSGDLAGLHDIVLPAPVGYLPQTIGWVILLGLAIGIAVWLGVVVRRRRRARRYRELALADLEALRRRYQEGVEQEGVEQESVRQEVFAALPELVKRTALVAFPRPEVASLNGEAWLEFLNRTYGGAGFTDGPGRWLPDLAYASGGGGPIPDDDEVARLTSLVGTWIRNHHQDEAVAAHDGGGR